MKIVVATLAALSVLAATQATPAVAHIVPTVREGTAGASFQTALTVTHGCAESGTISIRVRVPAEVLTLRPQYKAGWKLAIKYRPINPSVTVEHGVTIDKAVAEVTWTGGPIPSGAYDTFGLSMRLPDVGTGTLYFPTLQTCEKGSRDWAEIPASGQGPQMGPMEHMGHEASPAPAIVVKARDR